MIKRTLYFGNATYLSFKNKQLVIDIKADEPINIKAKQTTIAIEDIGVMMLDHGQITITQPLLNALLENNTALISCDARHMPMGLWLPLEGHYTQQERFEAQINASLPLKKQLWAQVIEQKLINQGCVLQQQNKNYKYLFELAKNIKSGDSENAEVHGAAYYWKNIFNFEFPFKRDKDGEAPNNLLNYGYAILRAITARSLVGSGLLPTLGIHHANKYNAYCLADDMMEPYRPFVDKIVLELIEEGEQLDYLSKEIKKSLLSIATVDVILDGQKSPLMNALQRTTASLAKCYEGTQKKLLLPSFIENDT